MDIVLRVKYPLFLSDSNETWIFLTYFPKIMKYQLSWKSVQWEPSSMRTDGRKWRSYYSLLAIMRSRLKTNAAICVNKMYRLNHLTPKYMNITIKSNNQQSISTKRMATNYRINQEPKFLYLKKQELIEHIPSAPTMCPSMVIHLELYSR